MSKTYLLIGDEQQGPYSADKIRAMLSTGEITAQTLYWEEGMTGWKALAEKPGLRPTSTTVAPPKRQRDSSATVDFKKAYTDRKDLSARTKSMTIGRAFVIFFFFFVFFTMLIAALSRWMPDPGQQFAERTGVISSHNK